MLGPSLRMQKKLKYPPGNPTFQSVASDLALYYLSMSHKKNARLIWVKYFCCICYSSVLFLH